MTDIVLIHPGAVHGIYGSLGDELVAIEPPLWPRLIAGYLRDRGFSVAIIDQELERTSPDELSLKVAILCPKIAAICVYGHQPSASTQQMTGARAVAQVLKRDHDGLTIVMLGNHPSALPERTLLEEPVDYVIDGEGPITLEGLLSKDCDSGAIPGLVWNRTTYNSSTGERLHDIVRNPLAPLLDLDRDLHGRAWDLLPSPTLYRSHNWQRFDAPASRSPYAAVYTSLGCSYKCSFCMINTFQHTNRYRMRSPAAVVAEIVELHRAYGVETFKIVDELFVLNRRHYREICRLLIEAGIKINFWCYSRTDTVTEEDLPLLYAAGCRWLALGIESGSVEVRGAANKALRANDVVATVKKIQAAGINVIANYIFGLPTDDLETMQLTLDLALTLNTEFANFYTCMAYPGSALYDEAIEKGWTLPDSWAGYSQHNRHTRPLDTARLSGAEVLRFRDRAFEVYFTSSRYRRMVERKFGSDAVRLVEQMTEYKLERDLLI
jgi:anaerobic magnesium-protoporphyrin IX monomethyl ester cyclase